MKEFDDSFSRYDTEHDRETDRRLATSSLHYALHSIARL